MRKRSEFCGSLTQWHLRPACRGASRFCPAHWTPRLGRSHSLPLLGLSVIERVYIASEKCFFNVYLFQELGCQSAINLKAKKNLLVLYF